MSSSGLQPLAHRIFEGLYRTYDRVLLVATLMQDSYWKNWILRLASPKERMEILDVGCGTGVLEESLERYRVSAVGLDLTEGMIRLAQRKRLTCLRSITLGDAENLPFQDSEFDAVFSCYVVKYCNPEQLASEILRVLRPQGRVFVYDFSRPRGPLAPFIAFYTYGLLRVVGLVLSRVDSGQAYTYQALPTVIRDRRWDDSFAMTMRACGFGEVGMKRLSGGVVTAFWGRKP